MAQMVKNLPAMQEAWVRSLGQEDPWEKGMATPVFFPGEFHGQRNLTGYSPWGCKESDTAEQVTEHRKLRPITLPGAAKKTIQGYVDLKNNKPVCKECKS